jgi:hypothetical protein
VQSCSDNSTQRRPHTYFDTEYLIDSIVQNIAQKKFILTKTVTIQQEKQELQFNADQIDWQKELKLFAEANINKTTFVGKYEVIESKDSVIYIAKDSSLSVKKTIIVTENSKLKVVIIKQKSSNFFYTTNRLLQLNFENNQMSSYQIQGSQKLIGLPTSYFEIEAFLTTDKNN